MYSVFFALTLQPLTQLPQSIGDRRLVVALFCFIVRIARRRLTALVNAASLARRNPASMSLRTLTGSMRSASRCWPISSR